MSRRDYSRSELRARLLRAAGAATADIGSDQAGSSQTNTDVAQVDQVLDTVQAEGLLSEDRFVEGFIRTRQARYGPVRLRHELLRHGVTPERIEAALKLVARDEYAAAHALWLRRFESAPANAREWARQARFLGARGFSHEVIRQVLTGR